MNFSFTNRGILGQGQNKDPPFGPGPWTAYMTPVHRPLIFLPPFHNHDQQKPIHRLPHLVNFKGKGVRPFLPIFTAKTNHNIKKKMRKKLVNSKKELIAGTWWCIQVSLHDVHVAAN